MTVKFNRETRNLMLGRGILAAMSATVGITIYSGTQPAAADITSNWSAYNSATSSYLIHFSGVGLTQPNSGTLINVNVYPASTAVVRAGTATWCIIWASNVSQASLDSTTLPNASFIVAPVSDVFGNGVVVLDNTTLTASTSILLANVNITAS